MTTRTKGRRSPWHDLTILAEAAAHRLYCTRDRDLAPTFRTNHTGVVIYPADHDQILRFVLAGLLEYEDWGPHGFGVGRLQLTRYGRHMYGQLQQKRRETLNTAKAGAE